MRPRDEHTVLPQVRDWTVWHPVSGGTHTFTREDQALGFAADLAITYSGGGTGAAAKPIRVEYPNGSIIELTGRVIRSPR